MTNAIEIKNLTHRYGEGTAFETIALDNINLTVKKGEILGIMGHTGSGKSTLISHFNGLLKPTEGTVIADGTDIWESKHTLRTARFKVGLCFQYPEYQLFEETVFKDIAFGPRNMKLSSEEINHRVYKAAQLAGISEDMLSKSPFDLSGGEKRRVAIAGIMAMEPQVLVFDEPAAGLDPKGRKDLIKLIKDYHRETGSTIVVVSHNMEDLASLAERIIVINKGKLALDGTVSEVFSQSASLKEMGLNVPEITEVFIRLKEMGFNVPLDVYTTQYGAEILKNLLGKKGGEKQ